MGEDHLRSGQITHGEWCLFDTLLWSCRTPGKDLAVASYSALQKLVHISRSTIVTALDKLEGLGLIGHIKRWVRSAASWPGKLSGARPSIAAPGTY